MRSADDLRARALRLLSRRDHTRLELKQKLTLHVEDPGELEALLDEFTARGWLCESRVVDQLVRAKRARFGPARIRRALIEKGVPEALVARALANLRETEVDAARAVWAQKFGTPAGTSAERARQVRFLQSRGFSLDVALRVARSNGASED